MLFKFFRSTFILSVFGYCWINTLWGQNEWFLNTQFFGFLDNREYNNSVQINKTILGQRLALNIGRIWEEKQLLNIGVNILKEFGSNIPGLWDTIQPTFFYHIHQEQQNFWLGVFPRAPINDYPLALIADTNRFYRPNLEGLLYQWHYPHNKFTAWVDWTSKKSDTQRENFLFGFSGAWGSDWWHISYYSYMLHDAFANVRSPGDTLKDNGAIWIEPSLDLASYVGSDIFKIGLTYFSSFERERGVTDYQIPTSGMLNLKFEKNNWGLKLLYKIGQSHNLVWGDPFYKAPQYGRLDMYSNLWQYEGLQTRVTLSIHHIEGHFDVQQIFYLLWDLDHKWTIAGN